MHSANLYESPRLQRVGRQLLSGGWISTMQMVAKANVCAVNSCIAELRAQGWDIDCRSRVKNERIWEYKLVSAPAKHRFFLDAQSDYIRRSSNLLMLQ